MAARIQQLQHRLRDRDVDAAVLNHPPDVYYFAGTGTQASLVVPASGNPALLVRINLDRARRDATVDDVRPSMGRHTILEVIEEVGAKTIGMACDVVPARLIDGLEAGSDGTLPVVDISDAILSVRGRKDEDEIAAIEAAADISQTCLEAVPDIVEPGVTETELQSELEKIKRQHGAEPEMVNRGWNMWNNFGITAAGPNTAEVSGFWVTITGSGMHAGRPYGASTYEIQDGDVIIVDHGTIVDGYHSDEARTFVVGEGRPEVESDAEVLFECLAAAKEVVEPGAPVSAPYERAFDVATAHGREDEFMALSQYGMEYVGHGVGLEIDEPPMIAGFNDETFEPGMTVALEPKFIYPDEWGATVEDTVLVTEDGSRTLTNTQRELIRC